MGELNTMSINFLDPEKCRFYINPNGFIALKTEDKDYRRVRLLRTLPLHRPFEYISVSDMNKNEIGIIRNAADFPPESREIIEKDLAARYYCPQISEIYSIDEKMGSFYFDVSIDGFKKTFGVKDISRNIKMLDSGAVMLTDADGNRIRYEVKGVKPAGADHWFEVSWKRGDKSFTAKVRVAMNGPKKLRIEEMK